MSEYSEQCAFFEWLKINESKENLLSLFFHIPNGEFRHPRTAVKLKLMGVKAGVLDNFLPVSRYHWHGLWIELKFGKNRMTDTQVAFAKEQVRLGYAVTAAYSWIDAAWDVCQYLNLNHEDFGIPCTHERAMPAYPNFLTNLNFLPNQDFGFVLRRPDQHTCAIEVENEPAKKPSRVRLKSQM